MSSFKEKIAHLKDLDNPVGDLVRDILRDSNFPDDRDTKEGVLSYIEFHASWQIKKTVKEAVEELFETYLQNWKFKKNIKPVGTSNGFWYDITMGGYIKPEELLDDPEQLNKLEKALKLVETFERALKDNDLLNEF